jgi:ERCC4-related helicase
MRCRKFVGQVGSRGSGVGAGAAGGGGGAGMKQKEQKAVLAAFRAAEFNTLVATCIGEEGLDIPAVDIIACLDVSASPTRSVQRSGRTGRHREGRVVYVLSAGREEEKYRQGLEVRAARSTRTGV